jgi:hypothetical protein
MKSLLLALALLGCSSKKEAPPTADKPAVAPAATIASDAEYNNRALKMLDNSVAAFKTAGTNCDKLADLLQNNYFDNETDIKALAAYVTAHPTVNDAFNKANAGKIDELEKTAQPTIHACSNNTKVMLAVAKLTMQ